MRQLGWIALVAFGLSACASNAPQPRAKMDWNRINSAPQVAKVSNMKSLISPGFY